MSGLNVYKETGEILFDTNLICYGLVKSGYMSWLQSWSRRTLRSANLDPSNGANYTPAIIYSPGTEEQGQRCDQIYGFTVYNPISPIVFITGSGTLAGSAVTSNSITFYYANATTSTRFYCFDLMADTLAGSTFLKTWDTTGRITFNSLQPPLNVVAAFQPPAPGSLLAPNGRNYLAYEGGRMQVREYISSDGRFGPKHDCIYDVALTSGVEYAAYLPWARTANIISTEESNQFTSSPQYNVSEGAYGRIGGISFMFGAAAGTNWAYSQSTNYVPATYSNIPVDRYPVALVIRTDNLIFPYN